MENNTIEGWVFTNKHGVWYTTTRDNYFALFNGVNDKVLSSKNIETLQDIINRTGGDEKLIKKLINEN